MMEDTPTEANAIDIEGLEHRFGAHQALAGVSFSVASGSIHGFVGPNGAGKTTCLKVVGTLMQPQRGTVQIFGRNIAKNVTQVRKQIGYMPDHFAMYKQMKVHEYLDFFAAAYGQPSADRETTVRDVLELTDMYERRDSLIRGLSRGMQQRVSLARVLVHDPRILLLDEPASGLDPRARIELMDILRELSAMGKTVFISSHILSELSSLCDSVTIIDRGLIKYTGGMEDLLTRTETGSMEYTLRFAAPARDLVAGLEAITGLSEARLDPEDEHVVTVSMEPGTAKTGDLLAQVIASGAELLEFQRSRRHLDEAFLDLTDPGVRA